MSGVRATRDEIDRRILDITAGLIARRGIRDTAVQAVADQAGYSKAGILNRFSSKDILVAAAISQCIRQTEAVREVAAEAGGDRQRDAAAVDGLTDLALERPGWAELVLAAVSTRRGDDVSDLLGPVAVALLGMFGIEPAAGPQLARRARVTGAIGALIVLSLTYEGEASADQAAALMRATSWSALGYEGSFPPR